MISTNLIYEFKIIIYINNIINNNNININKLPWMVLAAFSSFHFLVSITSTSFAFVTASFTRSDCLLLVYIYIY